LIDRFEKRIHLRIDFVRELESKPTSQRNTLARRPNSLLALKLRVYAQPPPVESRPMQDHVRDRAARSALIDSYLDECRRYVLDEIQSFVPRKSPYSAALYDLMLEYPLRNAKALRPALCIATCRALGGSLEGVLKSASVLEFYHNAFLIHDDVEDGSEKRRDKNTLHRDYGVPIAVNVGDAMLALALEPLLDNMRLLGMGKALQVIRLVARMARESAEGQALELSWIRGKQWKLRDRDYLRMVHKKTTWYTFITPLLVGGLIAGVTESELAGLGRFATALGSAFQIQDDVLNLSADEVAYGKEILGDLWEGKHTLALMHALRTAPDEDGARAQRILAKPRAATNNTDARVGKTRADVEYLYRLILKQRSLDHARLLAKRRAIRAKHSFAQLSKSCRASIHLEFLGGITDYVVDRER
jgi:geranylgeranyl diphosphate synthase type II